MTRKGMVMRFNLFKYFQKREVVAPTPVEALIKSITAFTEPDGKWYKMEAVFYAKKTEQNLVVDELCVRAIPAKKKVTDGFRPFHIIG